MKTIWGIGIIVLTMSSLGCNKDNRVELFKMTQVMDFEIKAGLNTIETHFFLQPAANSSFDEQLAISGFDESVVASVEPKFCEFTTVFKDVDLDFIRLIEIRVLDQFDPDFQREVFYLDPVPANTRTIIRPFPGLNDVKEIVSKPTFGIEVRIIFRYVPQSTYDMRLQMDFSVFGD
jgi:hypothetical protein